MLGIQPDYGSVFGPYVTYDMFYGALSARVNKILMKHQSTDISRKSSNMTVFYSFYVYVQGVLFLTSSKNQSQFSFNF